MTDNTLEVGSSWSSTVVDSETGLQIDTLHKIKAAYFQAEQIKYINAKQGLSKIKFSDTNRFKLVCKSNLCQFILSAIRQKDGSGKIRRLLWHNCQTDTRITNGENEQRQRRPKRLFLEAATNSNAKSNSVIVDTMHACVPGQEASKSKRNEVKNLYEKLKREGTSNMSYLQCSRSLSQHRGDDWHSQLMGMTL